MNEFIKKKLPRSSYKQLKDTKQYLEYHLLKVMARSQFTSTIYYAFFSTAFWREHQAIAFGRVMFEQDYRAVEGSQYLLRRNIHRLEKGLIMKPRRQIFALDYISETVQVYKYRLANSHQFLRQIDDEELKWAEDVLETYFKVVDPNPVINEAHQEFLLARQDKPVEQISTKVVKAPYKRDLEKPLSVSFDALLELAQRRRSVRWFLPKQVPRILIDKAITLAALSPSACNRQPFLFHIFDGEEDNIQRVASLALGTAGFNHNFPAIVVVIGQQRAYFSERDRHIIYIDGALASMSFIFALETFGLSSCCINWPDIEEQERKMTALLDLKPDERVVMLIAIGYPDPNEKVPYSAKKMLHSIRRYN